MNSTKFIKVNVKESNGEIRPQYVNVTHIIKIYENTKQEIIMQLTDYEEICLSEPNINILMDRFV